MDPSPEMQERFRYGSEMELNALATLAVKVMPVYFPQLNFREDSCMVLPIGSSYAVISGDGSGVNGSSITEVAFELKCPIPNKKFVTDVYYRLPKYYSTQVLSQMGAKNCQKFVDLCFTPESSTVLFGTHDNTVFTDMMHIASNLYGNDNPRRPTSKYHDIRALSAQIESYCDTVEFIAEFPSVSVEECKCNTIKATSFDDALTSHKPLDTTSKKDCSVVQFGMTITQAEELINEAYTLLCRPAKEILLTIASDLDRTKSETCVQYAVPIMYHLSGNSLKMSSVRSLLRDAIQMCNENQVTVKALCTDGQFLEIAVGDGDRTPLTLCRLQKQLWAEAKKIKKKDRTAFFAGKGYVGKVKSHDDVVLHYNYNFQRRPNEPMWIESVETYPQVFTPQTVKAAVNTATTCPDSNPEDPQPDPDYILQHLPLEIVVSLDIASIHAISKANAAIAELYRNDDKETTGGNGDKDRNGIQQGQHLECQQDEIACIEAALCALIASNE